METWISGEEGSMDEKIFRRNLYEETKCEMAM